MAELSPMMRQYLEIKEQNKNCLLFFRVGDFYEMFFDDAITASRELELVLTGKDCGLEERAPMCGVPYHSCDGYIARIIENLKFVKKLRDEGQINYLEIAMVMQERNFRTVPEFIDRCINEFGADKVRIRRFLPEKALPRFPLP